ncbi:hypothetical protein C0585_01070 [Candidatus Woesearchaeota archaeon]|nr:MAG: hypothetical protein C0585_01070 [Candidatus Woesearchaeota archaeon]
MRKSFLFFLILILLLSNSYAIGIRTSHLRHEIIFEPGYSSTLGYQLVSHSQPQDYDIYVRLDFGDEKMLDYFTVSDSTAYVSAGGTFDFTVDVNLPDEFETPGWHRVKVGVAETLSSGGFIGSSAAAEASISVLVLFPYEYIEADLSATNTNKGEKSEISLTVKNYGDKDIEGVHAKIDVYDNFGNYIKSLNTKFISLEKSKTAVLESEFLASEVGFYNLNATVYYSGKEAYASTILRSGQEDVEITGFTRSFYTGTINKMKVDVLSGWSEVIEDLYFVAEISNGSEILEKVQSQNFELVGFGKKSIDGFLDFTQIPVGNYTADVEIFFGDNSKSKSGTVEVTEPIEPIEEKPGVILPFIKDNGLLVSILFMNFMLMMLVLLLFIRNSRK